VSTTATSTKRAYRFREFCESFGVGKDAAYHAIRNGELIAHKRGKATIILAEDAERYVTSLPRLQLPSATTDKVRTPSVPRQGR
jgi:hypothetical protein